MAVIQIKTPKGVVQATIAGNTISGDELVKLKEMFPSDNESFEYETLSSDQAPEDETIEPETIEPETIEGEVKDNWLRFNTGRADDSDEKQKVLNEYLGEGTSVQVADDIFVIDQAKVAPEIRKKFGLADEGKIYLDKPGWSSQDLADFGGEAGPVLTAAIGAGLMVTGVGILPGAIIVGGVAALAKAADEAIEYTQERNLQSASEVGSSIVTEGVLNGVFQGAGGLLAKGIGRVFKGPGPDPSAARVDELVAQGLPRTNPLGLKMQKADEFPYFDSQPTARQIALEEGKAEMQQAIKAGAKPGLKEATGKNLAARGLAIAEAITGSTKVAEANTRFIKGLVDDLSSGTRTQDEVIQALKSEEGALASVIKERLADPDKSLAATKDLLNNVVKDEVKRWNQVFNPAKGVPEDFIEANKRVAELFKLEAQNNFSLARTTLGDKAVFSLAPLKGIITGLQQSNKYGDFSGKFFDVIKGLDKAGLDDLQSLKNLLQMTIKTQDQDIIATTAQGEIKALLKGLDKVLDDGYSDLSYQVSQRGARVLTKPRYRQTKTGERVLLNPEQMGWRQYSDVEVDQLRKGLQQWDEAKRLWGEGQEQYNNQALNSLIKSFDAKYFNSNKDVMKVAINNGDNAKLQMYLKAVTPPLGASSKLMKESTRAAIQRIRELVDGDNFETASNAIKMLNLGGVIPKIYPWLSKLPSDDAFRSIQKKGYLEELDRLLTISKFASNPEAVRTSIRNGLAKDWVSEVKESSLDKFGQFSPPTFAAKFTALQPDLQNTLFGEGNAQVMREAMDGFRLLGLADKKTADELFEALPTLVNQPIKESVGILKGISDQAVKESQEFMEAPGGVKDLVVQNLFKNTFPDTPLTEANIQSGAWGKALLKTINKQNKNGALDTILGKDVVTSLEKIGNYAVTVSDSLTKGMGQLVSAGAAGAIATLISTGHIVEAAAAYAVPWMFSRAMRNKRILKLMTSPGIRKQQYNAAIKAGAKLPPFKEWNLSTFATLAAQEMAIVAGANLRSSSREAAQAAEARGDDFTEQLAKLGLKSDSGSRSFDTSLVPLPDALDFSQQEPVPQEELSSEGGIRTLAPRIDGLYQREMDKLLYGTQ